MKLTAQIRLIPTQEQAAILLETMETANAPRLTHETPFGPVARAGIAKRRTARVSRSL